MALTRGLSKESMYEFVSPSVKVLLNHGAKNLLQVMEENRQLSEENKELKTMIAVLEFELCRLKGMDTKEGA